MKMPGKGYHLDLMLQPSYSAGVLGQGSQALSRSGGSSRVDKVRVLFRESSRVSKRVSKE